MAVHPFIAERKLEALRHALGDTILAALVEPAVVEIHVNPDGRLILDRSGEGPCAAWYEALPMYCVGPVRAVWSCTRTPLKNTVA